VANAFITKASKVFKKAGNNCKKTGGDENKPGDKTVRCPYGD